MTLDMKLVSWWPTISTSITFLGAPAGTILVFKAFTIANLIYKSITSFMIYSRAINFINIKDILFILLNDYDFNLLIKFIYFRALTCVWFALSFSSKETDKMVPSAACLNEKSSPMCAYITFHIFWVDLSLEISAWYTKAWKMEYLSFWKSQQLRKMQSATHGRDTLSLHAAAENRLGRDSLNVSKQGRAIRGHTPSDCVI